MHFESGPSGLAGEVGKNLDGGINMDLYMLNSENLTAKGAVSTFVHESSHFTRASRGFEIGTQVDEYMAFRREELFKLGRRPSLSERQELWRTKILSDPFYSKVPVGGDIPKILQGVSK